MRIAKKELIKLGSNFSVSKNPNKIFFTKSVVREIKKLVNQSFEDVLNLSKKKIYQTSTALSEFLNKLELSLNKNGLIIISLEENSQFDLNEKKKIYIIIGIYLGELMRQNSKNDVLVDVIDKGKNLKGGARYHESNAHGNLHTDSPQWKVAPRIVGLFCLQKAKKGGETILVDAKELIRFSIQSKKNHFQNMLKKYHFDKRGDISRGEKETTFAPILKINHNQIIFRYLRDYINTGHIKKRIALNRFRKKTLDFIDNFLSDEKNQTKIKLINNEMILFHNHYLVHGRSKFVDYKDLHKKRHYLRLWIK